MIYTSSLGQFFPIYDKFTIIHFKNLRANTLDNLLNMTVIQQEACLQGDKGTEHKGHGPLKPSERKKNGIIL